jgi:hypothetical protein
MELEGTVTSSGQVVFDNGESLDAGTRVRVTPLTQELPPNGSAWNLFADLVVDHPAAPTDLAAQHEHYRLGTPKR